MVWVWYVFDKNFPMGLRPELKFLSKAGRCKVFAVAPRSVRDGQPRREAIFVLEQHAESSLLPAFVNGSHVAN